MDKQLYKEIVSIFSNPCQDTKLQRFIEKQLNADKNTYDTLDNLICTFGNGKKKILISAHVDEVGFRVTYISKEGHIYFQNYGGVKQDIAVGQVVRILTENEILFGIIGKKKSISVTGETPYEELWIDVGNSNEVKDKVKIGDFILFDTQYYDLMPGYGMSRGGDNKLGIFAAIQAIKNISGKLPDDVTLYFVAATQEEIGSRGIETAMDSLKIEKSVIIDTIETTDTPGANIKKQGIISMGDGVVITRSPNINPNFFKELYDVAQDNKLPLQVVAKAEETSTDARKSQTIGDGILTALVSIPIRYMHYPAQVFNWKDIETTTTFLEKFILSQ